MTDEKPGVEEQVEAPTADIPESGSQPEQEAQPDPETQESPEAETGKNEVDEKPPKDNAAWAAMRAENKRLKEAVETIDPEYLEKLRGATSPQEYQYPQVQQIPEDAEYTQVTQGLNWAQQQASQANREISQLKAQLERQQDSQAMETFPELKTDRVFQQLVAEKKLAARVLGNYRTTTEIAREVKKLLDRRGEQVSVATQEEVKRQQLEKQTAMAEAKGTATGGSPHNDDETLRQRVREGDSQSEQELARRLIDNLEF